MNEDAFFQNPLQALKIAKQQNLIDSYGKLQICYYDGKIIKSNLQSLIHLPVKDIPDKLLQLGTRPPTKIVLNDATEILLQKTYVENLETKIRSIDETSSTFAKEIISKLKIFEKTKNEQYNQIIKTIKKQTINFNEKLRFYISADYGAKVVLDVYRTLKHTIEKLGYEIYYDENNDIELLDDYRRAVAIEKFKPHITININRVRNGFINDDTFNFIWFQDLTLILVDTSKINVRKRDYFFYLTSNLKDALLNKQVPLKKIFFQSFATRNEIFYIESKIKKDNKIIFFGNDYMKTIDFLGEYKKCSDLFMMISTLFNENKLTEKVLDKLSIKYHKLGILRDTNDLKNFIFPAIVRIEVLKWLCNIQKLPIEIYGLGWDKYPELKPYYHGVISSTDKLRKTINSSKYSLILHPEYFYQQRLLEASACGSIPIIYEDVNNKEIFRHRENVLIFKNKKELEQVLDKVPLKDPKQIAKDISYNKFIKFMLEIVQKES